MGEFVKKLWHATKSRGEDIGLPFLILGCLGILAQFILVLIGLRDESSLLGVALGLISVGLGFTAVGMGTKSDERMKAMADLQFDEALGSLIDYSEQAQSWQNMFYYARAALRLEPWASEPMKRELKRALTEVKQQAQKDDKGLVSEIDRLWCEYGIDKWSE